MSQIIYIVLYHDRHKIARVAALAFLVAAFTGCSKKPEVTGEVLDGFGKPLPGATVTIAQTTFATTTDNGGRYAVEYVPGKVLVTVTKEGYTSQNLALDMRALRDVATTLETFFDRTSKRASPVDTNTISGLHYDCAPFLTRSLRKVGTGKITLTDIWKRGSTSLAIASYS